MPSCKLPNELERMIFALVPRPMAHTCLRVAKRVKVWLEPELYHAVCLSTDIRAKRFIQSVYHRPDFAQSTVKILCINISVHQKNTAAVLTICHGVVSLNMRFPCHLLGNNPILEPLNRLTCVNALYVDLSSIFNTRNIYLPKIVIFEQITHLHLTNAWVSWFPTADAIGLEDLKQITHLSLCLSTARTLPVLLKKILDRQNFAVLVLWKRASTPDSFVVNFLAEGNINDRRTLVLNDQWFRHYMLSHAFWACADRFVKSREVSETGLLFRGEADTMIACLVENAQTSFHLDAEWTVATDVESSDSGEEDSDGESGASNDEESSDGQ